MRIDSCRTNSDCSVQLILRASSIRVAKDIPRSLDDMEQRLVQGLVKATDDLSSAMKQQTAQAAPMLANMCSMMSDANRQIEILKSLKFEEIRDRWGRIKDPHEETYSWVFKAMPEAPPTTMFSDRMQEWLMRQPRLAPLNFMEWLEKGNGIYWITGKPGCGKSTLMKYITDHKTTKAGLERWADKTPLITAMHYFWYLGTPMQRSYEGLLQSLLWNILRQCPDIIQHTCRARWDDEALASTRWQKSELRDSVSRLTAGHLSQTGKRLHFCFFVDGIDEYDGDHEDVLNFLLELSRADNIKICASSRPWEVFQTAFADTLTRANSFELHEHTRYDIFKVISDELEPYRSRWPTYDTVLDDLMQEIAEKAKGVFLWVTLVIKQELKPGIEGRDSIEELRERLKNIPEGNFLAHEQCLNVIDDGTGLLPYLEHIFKKLPKRYKRDAARIFLTSMRSTSPLPTPAVEIIKAKSPHKLVSQAPVKSNYDWDAPDHIEEVRAQINTRCRDMMSVELPSVSHGILLRNLHLVEFLHRSVKDFLEQPVIYREIVRLAGEGFCAQSTLFAVYVSLTKRLPDVKAGSPIQDRASTFLSAEWWATLALLHESRSTSGLVHFDLLERLDKAMESLVKPVDTCCGHWTNSANPVRENERSEDPLENGQRDLLGHLIELGLDAYVNAMLKRQPDVVNQKQGRPYLDYALRYSKQRWPDHGGLKDFTALLKGPQESMVKILLDRGANINQKVCTHNDRTILDLYLDFLVSRSKGNHHESYVTILRLLVGHGAYCVLGDDMDLDSKLRAATDGFGEYASHGLTNAIRANAKKYERPWYLPFKFW